MKKFLFTFIALSFVIQLNASHILGGEMYYDRDATNPNLYTVSLILYRDVTGITMGNTQMITTNIPGNSSLTLQLAAPATTIKAHCLKTAEAYLYTGTVLINSIPTGGIDFTWNSCCRSSGIDNLIFSGGNGFSIRARMFSHGNSPRFLAPPTLSGFADKMQNFNVMASDPDNSDSVFVLLVNPKELQGSTPTSIPFKTGYSAQTPFGNNVPTTLDPNAGILSVDSVPIGTYVTAFLIRSYTNGMITSVASRDIVFFYGATGDLPSIEIMNVNGTAVTNQIGQNYYVEMTEGDDLNFTVKGEIMDTSKLVAVSGYGNLLTNNSGGGNCTGNNCASFTTASGIFSNNGEMFVDFTFNPDTSFVDNMYNKYFQNFSFNAEIADSCGVIRSRSIGVFVTINKAQSMYSVSSYNSCKGVGVKAQINGDTSSVLWSPSYGVGNTMSASPVLNPDSNMVYTVSNSNSGVSFKVHVFVDSISVNSFVLTNTGAELVVPIIDPMQTNRWFYNGALLPVSSDTLPLLLTGFYWASIQKGSCVVYSDTVKATVTLKTSNSSTNGGSVDVNASISSFEFSLNNYSNTLTDLDVVMPEPGFNKTTATVNVVISQNGTVINSLATQKENDYLYKVENINAILTPGLTYKIEVTTDQTEMVLFEPQTLPFVEDNGIVNIINGEYTENGNVMQGAYPYVNFVFSSPVGIIENGIGANIYPNPATNHLFVEMTIEGQINIFDIHGRVVLNADVNGNEKVDISQLPTGIYIYSLENEEGIKTGKLVVE